jgi:hypothetical protein
MSFDLISLHEKGLLSPYKILLILDTSRLKIL